MRTITVNHNFETAHRLPHLPGKCESLHGHSWWVGVTVGAGETDDQGLIVEFGPYKKLLRGWIDTHLDHGTMLGPDDPLVPVLRSHGCKVHEVVGYPTVENVALMISDIAEMALDATPHAPYARVLRVVVRETHVNSASWEQA